MPDKLIPRIFLVETLVARNGVFLTGAESFITINWTDTLTLNASELVKFKTYSCCCKYKIYPSTYSGAIQLNDTLQLLQHVQRGSMLAPKDLRVVDIRKNKEDISFTAATEKSIAQFISIESNFNVQFISIRKVLLHWNSGSSNLNVATCQYGIYSTFTNETKTNVEKTIRKTVRRQFSM